MDLKEHFEAYRSLVKNDILGGSEEYSKSLPTLNPRLYPTASDYLTSAVTAIKRAIDNNDLPAYKDGLINHQKAMFKMLRSFVDSRLDSVRGSGIKESPIEHLIGEYNDWRWLKFNPSALTFKITCKTDPKIDPYMAILPVYQNKKKWECDNAVVMDADEMALVEQYKVPARTPEILKFKMENFWKKIVKIEKDYILAVPLEEINEGRVRDWTQPIFNKENPF